MKSIRSNRRRSIFPACLAIFSTFLLLGIVRSDAAPAANCPIPLETGNRWTYEAIVRWTAEDSGTHGPTKVHWTMEALAVVTNASARAVVVRGLPAELTGYKPGLKPGYDVLLIAGNGVYRFEASTEGAASAKARELLKTGNSGLAEADELIALPLARGKAWAGDTDRRDHWYCWHVEEEGRGRPRVKSSPVAGAVPTWLIAYRTNPDHQIMEIAEGLGITRYVYEHHGTVQSVDARLVEFKRAGI